MKTPRHPFLTTPGLSRMLFRINSPRRAASAAWVLLTLTSLANAASPFYEETFNQGGQSVELANGAMIGDAGSGASGKPDDLSYQAAAGEPDVPGAFARIRDELPADPLEECTVTVWFKSSADLSDKIASIFNTRGTVLFWGKNQWIFRVNDSTGEAGGGKYYGAGPVIEPNPGEWKFLACTWTRAANEATFYSGGKTAAVQLEGSSHMDGPGPVLTFDDPKHPRTIGNTFVRAANETFPGNIDNLRFFDKVLTEEQIEKIRQADAENKALDAK